MKILVIHTYYQIRGGEDQVFEQERDLLSEDNDVRTLIFYNKGGFEGIKQFLNLQNNQNANHELEQILLDFKPEVAHIHNLHFGAGWGLLDILRKYKVPVIMTIHNYRLLCPSATLFNSNGLFLDSLEGSFPWNAVKKRVYKNSVILTFWLAFVNTQIRKKDKLKQLSRLIVLTDFAKTLYLNSKLNLDSNKVVVKPNFVNQKLEIVNLERGSHFLFVGRLSEEKGLDVILNAFSNSKFRIKIAGIGPLQGTVEDFVEKYPDNFEYLGKLDSNQVEKEMKTASALIFPSLWFEGLPMTIIEAFACCLPVIASDLGAMSSLICSSLNGLHSEAGNYKDLQAKLEDWGTLSTEAKSKMRKEAFRTYQENYTPKKNYESLIEIYGEVIKEISHE